LADRAALAAAIISRAAAPLRNAKPALAAPTAAAIVTLEYRVAVDSIIASLAATSRGAGPGPTVLASCSSSAIRQALIPGGPISRIVVTRSPPQRTLAAMLSSEKLTDTSSKPILRVMTSIHSRVRVAVFPARNINAPNHSSTSVASLSATEGASSFVVRCEVALGLGIDGMTGLCPREEFT
jgi:hypothetical protein